MTYVGAPCIYYGDEIGLPGGPDPDCRRAFPWDEASWNHETLALTRALTAARHATPALRSGDFRVLHAQGETLVYARENGDSQAVIAMNAGHQHADLPLPGVTKANYRDALTGEVFELCPCQTVPVEARSARVLIPE